MFLESGILPSPYFSESPIWIPAAGGGGAGFAPVSSVSEVIGQNGGSTSAIDTTGANLIVLTVPYYPLLGGTPTVSDSKGNSWTALTLQANQGAVRLYYCVSPIVGSGHTFTATGTDIYATIDVLAFSGASASPYDQESGSAFDSPGSITPPQDGCLLVTASSNNGGTTSVDSGFTGFTHDFTPGSHMGGGIAYLIQSAAAAVNPTWTGSNAVCVMASFKPQ